MGYHQCRACLMPPFLRPSRHLLICTAQNSCSLPIILPKSTCSWNTHSYFPFRRSITPSREKNTGNSHCDDQSPTTHTCSNQALIAVPSVFLSVFWYTLNHDDVRTTRLGNRPRALLQPSERSPPRSFNANGFGAFLGDASLLRHQWDCSTPRKVCKHPPRKIPSVPVQALLASEPSTTDSIFQGLPHCILGCCWSLQPRSCFARAWFNFYGCRNGVGSHWLFGTGHPCLLLRLVLAYKNVKTRCHFSRQCR